MTEETAKRIKNELSEISTWLLCGAILLCINTCRINENLEKIANATTQAATQRAVEGGK